MKKKNQIRLFAFLLCAATLFSFASCSKISSGAQDNRPSGYIPPKSWSEGSAELTGKVYQSSYTRADIPSVLSSALISADNASGRICSVDTTFTIKTNGDTSSEEILKYLDSYPSINFTCTKSGDDSYKLSPSDSLEPNTVYRLSFGGDNAISSFAFQTESIFGLDSAFPADLAINVPVDSGIELKFTEAVAIPLSKMDDYISVSPSTDGEYLLYPDKKTVVFAPTNKLKTNTVYTVTVSKDIYGESGRELGEDISVRFRTSASEIDKNDEKISFHLNNSMPVFLPDDPMYVSYYANYYGNENFSHNNAKIKIYRYNSSRDAVDAMKEYLENAPEYIYSGKNYVYPTKGLTLVCETDATPVSKNGRTYGQQYLDIPSLEEGAYLVCVSPSATIGNVSFTETLQAFLQVSDYVVYTESSNDTLLWVNSASGKTTENIEIRAELFSSPDGWNVENTDSSYTNISAKTDKDGIAILDTSVNAEANSAFVTVDDSLILCLSEINNRKNTQKYLSWVYTDRQVYFGSDTVNFSGVITPIYSDTSLPEYIYLTTSISNVKQKIKVDSDGSFSGSFSYEDYASYYRSNVWMSFTDSEDNFVASSNISITSESKPTYTASLSFDRIFYEYGDDATLNLKASFFDGTPAPGLTFEVYIDRIINRTTVVTDENGEAKINFTFGSLNTYSTYPSSIYASAYLSGYETTDLSLRASTVYFQSKNYLRAERDEDGENIVVKLNEFDTSSISTSDDLQWNVFPENCIGAPAHGNITVSLIKVNYIKTERSSTYNPITKKTEKTYYYNVVENTVRTSGYDFKNGIVTLECLDREPDCSYYYKISYYDSQMKSTVTLTVGALKHTENYYFDYGDYYTLTPSFTNDDLVAAGDTVSYTLEYGGKIAADEKILHTVYSAIDGKRREAMITTEGFSVEYHSDYIFGVSFTAAVFDGRKISTLWVQRPSYDYERNNALNVGITTDATTYKPGDDCVISIKASDVNGFPASGAVIAVGIVDEACFALGDQVLYPLRDYFSVGYSSPVQNRHFSCFGKYSLYNGMGVDDLVTEEAESASDSKNDAPGDTGAVENDRSEKYDSVDIRESFKDNPLFSLITLDENGEASLTFKVPDNITEWRITASGFMKEENLSGALLGHKTTDVIATLPFFASVSLSDTYVLGDDISATARIFGSMVNAGEPVSYLAQLTDYDGNILREIEVFGKCGEFTHINLGKLEVGNYALTVKALCNEYSDGVKMPFLVCPDGFTMAVRRTVSANEIASLDPTLYPLTLSFSNASYSDYLNIVNHISSVYYNRADSLSARFVAQSAYDSIFGDGFVHDDQEKIKNTLSEFASNGLIPLMPYAEGDIVLSAEIAAVAPELISANRKISLCNSFNNIISKQTYKTDVQLAACLLGLAAFGEPVLGDIYAVAESNVSDEAKLYLSYALAVIGDYSGARELYDIILDGKFTGDREIYVSAETLEDRIRLTALALMTASYVDAERALPMAKYVMSHTSTLDVYTLELAVYVKCFYPIGDTETTFTYSIGNEVSETVTLKPGEVYTLHLGKEDHKMLTVDADESVIIRAAYLGGISEALNEESADKNATITKTIEPYDTSRGLYKVSISYTVTFDTKNASFTLSDRIPSGARFFSAYEEKGNISNTDHYSYAYLRNSGQMMTGYVGMYNPTETPILGSMERTVSGTVSYLIRAAVSGEFTVCEAVMQNCNDGKYALSGGGKIEIKEDLKKPWTISVK